MELLILLKEIMEKTKSFEKTKNFYFENHTCEKDGNNKRINLEFKLANDNTDKIMKFGFCQDCGKGFYCYDYESKGI